MISLRKKKKWLEPNKQQWVEALLQMWGAWEVSGLDSERRINMIYRFMKPVEGVGTLAPREACNDELGRLVNEIYTVHTKHNIMLRDIIKQRYWFGRSVNQIALYYRSHDDERKSVRHWNDIIKQKLRSIEYIFAESIENQINSKKNAKFLKKYQFKP